MGKSTNEYPGITFSEDCSKCQIQFRYENVKGEICKKKKTFEIVDYAMSKPQRKQYLSNQAYTYRAKVKMKKGKVATFNEFVDNEFWKECENDELSVSTTDRYETILERAKKSCIGEMDLEEITKENLEQFYESLKLEQTMITKTGKEKKYKLSNRTILHHQKVVSSVLSRAMYAGYIERNVAETVKNIKVKSKETLTLNIVDLRKLLELLKNESIVYRTIISLIIYTGMRRSEVLALRWEDIDFKNKILKVRRAIILTKGNVLIEKETKTSKSTRDITLPDIAIRLLKEYKVWQDMERLRCGYNYTGKLFTNWTGESENMLMPDTVSAWFSEFIVRSGLPKVTLHSLRHANITIMIAMGVDPKTASVRAGHSSTGITMEIYTHFERSQDIIAAEKINKVFA